MEIFKINITVFILFVCNCVLAEPLKLEQIISLAEENNTDLKQLREQLLLDDLKYLQQSKQFTPKIKPIDLNASFIDSDPTLSSGMNMDLPTGGKLDLNYTHEMFSKDPQYSLTLTQPLTKNTETINQKLKSISLDIETLQAKQKYETTMLTIISKYRSCVLEKLSMEQQAESIKDMHNQINKSKIKLKHGEISENEFNKSLLAIEKSSLELIKLEKSSELSLIQLKKMIGFPPLQPIEIDTSIAFSEIDFNPHDALLSAQKHSHKVKIDELQYQNAILKHKLELTSNQPSLSVYGSIDQDSTPSAGIRFRYSPPNIDTEVSDAQNILNYTQAQQSYNDAVMNLSTSIHKDLIELEHQTQLIRISAKALKNAQAVYHAESIKLKYQDISEHDFQKASVDLNSAYKESLNTQLEYCSLRDNFLQKIGQYDHIVQQIETNHV